MITYSSRRDQGKNIAPKGGEGTNDNTQKWARKARKARIVNDERQTTKGARSRCSRVPRAKCMAGLNILSVGLCFGVCVKGHQESNLKQRSREHCLPMPPKA
jgi:hypothetical protein